MLRVILQTCTQNLQFMRLEHTPPALTFNDFAFPPHRLFTFVT
jgi:hypothetical protein